MAYIKRTGDPASFDLRLPCRILKLGGRPSLIRCNTTKISGRQVVISDVELTGSPGDAIEFEIEMPRPHAKPQVRLHCVGRIAHSAPDGTTLTIERYIFERGPSE